jgi:hypothetical protein
VGGTLAQYGGSLGRGTCPSCGKGGRGGIFENNAPPSPPSPTASYEQENRYPFTTPGDSGEAHL